MALSSAEQATIHFYSWDYRYRGYYLFNTPVDIEPPYQSFSYPVISNKSVEDDGRVPSLFERIGNLLETKKEEEEYKDEEEFNPIYLEPENVSELKAFRFVFPHNYEIQPARNVEFLNMLSLSESVISFEIIAQHNKISFQFVCSVYDYQRITSNLKAYFPEAILNPIDCRDLCFNVSTNIAIADFGVSEEFVRPLKVADSFNIEPLTSIIASLDHIDEGETAMVQVLFKGINSPLARDIPKAVSDGTGGSFFVDAPEMPKCAQDKITSPLFSVVLRIAVQGKTESKSRFLSQEMARSITNTSTSEYNKLIPLSNSGYAYDFHQYNLYNRLSNRLGFILNAKELNTFVHYPNKTLVNAKIGLTDAKTKAPKHLSKQGIFLGINHHNGKETKVVVSTEQRLSHTHITGVTGVGKSTLMANMVLQDAHHGFGCTILDPHGDIIEDILRRIPEHRKDDVILIDPSDTDFPVGFNLLEANTEAEKIVLSSDLVSSFKRHATAWGDNMTSVLQNAVNTILESSTGGTLIELKRFLIEERFRQSFLKHVEDPSLHYYWKHEYPMLRKGITPLLTRIDTFLRPKIIRYMLAQKSGINFKTCIEQNKIVLIKLSQGLIGEENSYLLGSLYLSKLNQAAMGRQHLSKDQRYPYFLYCDEFQHFMTPSINNILSGARKYGLGLTLAHQELSQIEDSKLLNSVISNPLTRICFRLGDNDAKRLASGFSYFEPEDLTSLSRGEAIVRIGESSNDFNLKTKTLNEVQNSAIANYIRDNVRKEYATTKEEVEAILFSMLPQIPYQQSNVKKPKAEEDTEKETQPVIEKTKEPESKKEPSKQISDEVKQQLIKEESASMEVRAHTHLQSMIKKLGQDRNFIAHKEYPTEDGGRIDIVLERDELKISFEISETNSPSYEVQNIKKCLRSGCIPVIMVSKHQDHLLKIQKLAHKELSKNDMSLVSFLHPDEIPTLLDGLNTEPKKNEEVVKGYRIVTEIDAEEVSKTKSIKSQLARLFKGKK